MFPRAHLDISQPNSCVRSLYPAPAPDVKVAFVREATDGGPSCTAGADAVASGCVRAVVASGPGTALLDVSTSHHRCSQPDYTATDHVLPLGSNCLHAVGMWQLWTMEATTDFVLLGDLTSYVSLSGYRFRLPQAPAGGTIGEHLVVVGLPGEIVDVTYLRRTSGAAQGRATGAWTIMVERVVVGSNGRMAVTLS